MYNWIEVASGAVSSRLSLEACNIDLQVLEEYGTAASMLPPLPPPSSASMQPSGVT